MISEIYITVFQEQSSTKIVHEYLVLPSHFSQLNGKEYRQTGARGGVVVKALRCKLACHGFDSRWCHWNFSVT